MLQLSSACRRLQPPRFRLGLLLALAGPLAWTVPGNAAEPSAVSAQSAGALSLMSLNTSGRAASRSSATCSISADGRLALFMSDATDLVPGDTNGRADLFLRDLATGTTTRVSTQGNGSQLPAGGSCVGSSLTPDGRFVGFSSAGAIFVKNVATGQLTQASPAVGSVPMVTGFYGIALSDDGSRVVFLTQPETIYLGAYLWVNKIPARLMVRNLNDGSLVTLPTDNGVVADGEVTSVQFAISPDGTRVAFVSSSATLVAGDANGQPDIFVQDIADGSRTLASSTSDGVPAIPATTGLASYGRLALLPGNVLGFYAAQPSSLGERGLYRKDLETGALRFVLGDADGAATGVLTADASRVAFQRAYSGFDARIFVRDIASGVETLVSASASGVASTGNSSGPAISRDGSVVLFGSNARNLVSPRPPANVYQVYAKSVGAAAASDR